VSEPSSLRGAEQPVVLGVSPEREWLTYAEASRMVGLSRVTLWKLISADSVAIRISPFRLGYADATNV
jgi:hypothetical protein